MDNIILLGFGGLAESGKDFIAGYLVHLLGKKCPKYLRIAFADKLKEYTSSKRGYSYADLYVTKKKGVRFALQEDGDEIKNKYGNDYFVNAIELDIMKHIHRSNVKLFLITDVRYPQEAEWIKKNNGILIYIDAPNRSKKNMLKKDTKENVEKQKKHSSENMLKHKDFDYIINNDNDDFIEDKLKEVFYVINQRITDFS